jgi:hypothetical protein
MPDVWQPPVYRLMKRPYGNREDSKKIVELLRTRLDLTYEEIGKEFGRTPYAVGALASRNGLKHGRIGPRLHKIRNFVPKYHAVVAQRTLQQQHEDALLDYVQTHPEMTYKEIASVFDVPAYTVGNVVYRRGFRRAAVTEEAKTEQAELANYVKAHPNESYSDIGRSLNLPTIYVARVARKYGLFRGKGQGPRHNAGRTGYGFPRTDEEREYLSKVMTDIWASVSGKHRNRLSRIMRGSWTEERKHQLSLALKNMWREAGRQNE